ncbi:MAG: Rrf2 family transcriptional regulator [Lachnospiraceae bacterium]|nr:Rrf2 family transcriptional regulator [Lachnospiraceae bacterium]
MKISTKGRYALRLMLELASDNTGRPKSIKDISQSQDISEKYLEQIISLLNKAGMVKSIRGAQGGYVLTKEPKEYTVGMIFRVTEGDLAPVKCVSDGEDACDRRANCIPAMLYEKINDAVNNVVDTTTLEDLMRWQTEKKDNE